MLVALSIPLSLLITLLAFKLLGISLNIISLSGLILGVGMIVDNSIIVIDNILQKLHSGNTLAEAICQGTAEVFTPMLSSVLTTCSVFVPLIFIGGMTGALFYDQSMGIAIALFASLAVSMIVLPVYFKVLYQKVHKRKLEKGEALVADDEKNVTKTNLAILRWYEKTQSWMFAHLRLCLFLFLLSAPGLVVMF